MPHYRLAIPAMLYVPVFVNTQADAVEVGGTIRGVLAQADKPAADGHALSEYLANELAAEALEHDSVGPKGDLLRNAARALNISRYSMFTTGPTIYLVDDGRQEIQVIDEVEEGKANSHG